VKQGGVTNLLAGIQRRGVGVLGALVLEMIILTLLTSHFGGEKVFESTFLNLDNLSKVVRALSFIAIMACGEAVVIISGGIDLSVGSLLGLSGVVCGLALRAGWPILGGIALGLLVGLVLGLVNGVFITRTHLPPFIATLGMLSIARGLAYGITGGLTIRDLPAPFLTLGQGALLGVPYPIIVLVAFAVLVGTMLRSTLWGRYAYAIGGNELATIYSGVRVGNLKLFYYGLCGFAAALAGVLYTARFGVAQSTAGFGYELDVIAAAVIGGTSLSGGRGTIFGVIVGSCLMGILRNGLVLLGVSAYWQQVAIGAVIILAVMLDRREKT